MDRAFAVKRQRAKVSFGRKSDRGERFQQSRADYRDHRSGRLLFVRAASGKGVHGCTESCGAPAICCDRASTIFGAMKKFMVAAYFSIMVIFPTARLSVALLPMFSRRNCIISPDKAMSV